MRQTNDIEERKDIISQDVSNEIQTDNSMSKGELKMPPANSQLKHRLTIVNRQSKNNIDKLTQNTMANVLLRKTQSKRNLDSKESSMIGANKNPYDLP